jgi:hypothetical protein
MTQEQARQEAERRVEEFNPFAETWDCYWDRPLTDKNDVKCALISINREIELLELCIKKAPNYFLNQNSKT